MNKEDIEQYLESDRSVDRFMVVGRVLLVEISGRPIAVFDDAEKWINCRHSRTPLPETTRLEDWIPGGDEHRVNEWKFWGILNANKGRTTGEMKSPPNKEKVKFNKNIAVAEHHFWWFVHNCIAHPIIGLLPHKKTFAFHDYTSDKLNSKNRT